MPKRIRLSRSWGWRLPEGGRKVARPGPFGNPFLVDPVGDPAAAHAEAVGAFRDWITLPEQAGLRERARRELRGRDLACWCASDLPCHAEVLLEIANAN